MTVWGWRSENTESHCVDESVADDGGWEHCVTWCAEPGGGGHWLGLLWSINYNKLAFNCQAAAALIWIHNTNININISAHNHNHKNKNYEIFLIADCL